MSRMGSSSLWGKITVLVALCGWCLSAQAKYDGGSGTEAEPFRIGAVSDWEELMATPADWASRFVLTADIDLNDVSITPIAPDTSTSSGFQGTQFTGVFDGNDYVIRNADVNMPGSDYVGLFGYLGTGGQIKNLGAEDASIVGDDFVGGLVGSNGGTISNCYSSGSVSGEGLVGGLMGSNSGAISNCYSSGLVSGTGDYVGGLAGYNGWEATISNCYSTGSVTGGSYLGGLVGYNYYGTISNCYSVGLVSGEEDVGGLVGENWDGAIRNCYSAGPVSATGYYAGGLVGRNGERRGAYPGWIDNCYSSGSVSGTYYVGGLVGYNYYSTISNCYSTASVSGGWLVGGLVGYNYYNGIISSCYSTGSVSGTGDSVGGLVGVNYISVVSSSFWDVNTSSWPTSAAGTGKTTGEMKTQSTFTDAAWDFIGETDNGTNDIWRRCVDGVDYPRLTWEYVQGGDFACPDGVNGGDLKVLCEDWLSTYSQALYGADADGDKEVTFADFAVLADHWLSGL